jgi:hypothetical protein
VAIPILNPSESEKHLCQLPSSQNGFFQLQIRPPKLNPARSHLRVPRSKSRSELRVKTLLELQVQNRHRQPNCWTSLPRFSLSTTLRILDVFSLQNVRVLTEGSMRVGEVVKKETIHSVRFTRNGTSEGYRRAMCHQNSKRHRKRPRPRQLRRSRPSQRLRSHLQAAVRIVMWRW